MEVGEEERMEQHLEGLDSAILTAKAPEASGGFRRLQAKKEKAI